MKITESPPESHVAFRARAKDAFTLPEMMISLTLFLLLILGIVGANIFGLTWFQITQTKLMASDWARKSVGGMSDEIRNCSSTLIGNVSNGVFVATVAGEPLAGTSLMIYPSNNNSSTYIVYFYNAADQSFRRTSMPSGTTTIVAQSVTNNLIFQMENCMGNVLSNSQNNYVIYCTLEFYQTAPQSPVPDFYKLETAVTPRSID
jgi:prepilin-type N-terminal cleavage/methylation domain-containing protein